MDIGTIAFAAFLVGIPIVVAVLMLAYPVATLMVGGVLVVYAGGIVAALSAGVDVSAGVVGSLVGGLAISAGIGLIVVGFVMIGAGGILSAVLRAHRRQLPMPDLSPEYSEEPAPNRW